MAWGSCTVRAAGSAGAACAAPVADQPVPRALSVAAALPQPAPAAPSSLLVVVAPPAVADQSRCSATFCAARPVAGTVIPSTCVFSYPAGPATVRLPDVAGARPRKR